MPARAAGAAPRRISARPHRPVPPPSPHRARCSPPAKPRHPVYLLEDLISCISQLQSSRLDSWKCRKPAARAVLHAGRLGSGSAAPRESQYSQCPSQHSPALPQGHARLVQDDARLAQGDASASEKVNPLFGRQRGASTGDACDGSRSERHRRRGPGRALSFWAGDAEGCGGMQWDVTGCGGHGLLTACSPSGQEALLYTQSHPWRRPSKDKRVLGWLLAALMKQGGRRLVPPS